MSGYRSEAGSRDLRAGDGFPGILIHRACDRPSKICQEAKSSRPAPRERCSRTGILLPLSLDQLLKVFDYCSRAPGDRAYDCEQRSVCCTVERIFGKWDIKQDVRGVDLTLIYLFHQKR